MSGETLTNTVYSVKAGHNVALGTRQWVLNCGNKVALIIDPNDKDSRIIYDVFRQLVTLPLDDMQRNEQKDILPRLRVTYKRGIDKVTGREVRRVTNLEALPATQNMLDSADRKVMIADLITYAEKLGVLETKRPQVNEIISNHITAPNVPAPDAAKLEIARLVKLKGKPLTEEETTQVAAASAHITEQAAALNTPEEIVTAPADEKIDLNETFPRTPDGKPVDTPAEADKPYRKDAKATIQAMPAHIKKVLGEEPGIHIRKIFSMAIDLWLEKNNNDLAKAWQMCDEYLDGLLSLRLANAENAPEGARNAQGATGTPDVHVASKLVPQSPAAKPEPIAVSKPEPTTAKPKLEPAAMLTELKTLTGIPMLEIQRYLNRKHDQRYYTKIKAKNKDNYWTDLNPIAVRKRFDKVFGFQGLGWRIIPAAGGGQVSCESFMQKTQNGERAMFKVTMNAYVLEYALIDAAGNVQYVQTSAFSDADTNDDIGYAHRGAFTSLMKQALKMLGGFDHFMDDAPDTDEAAA